MADDRDEERAPLLKDTSNGYEPPPTYTPYEANQQVNNASQSSSAPPPVTAPPIGPDELPPPYTPTIQGGIPMVNCKVCQAMINMEGKGSQHVVKCGVCQEATPIKAAPPGKKYIRCPCNCLLICRSTAARIACPRPNCQRVITVGIVAPQMTANRSRIGCGHCGEVFLFDMTRNRLVRCPHCRRISAIGARYAKIRAIIYLILGLMLVGTGIAVTIGTYDIARHSGGIYVVWVGAFVSGVVFLIRASYYSCCMRDEHFSQIDPCVIIGVEHGFASVSKDDRQTPDTETAHSDCTQKLDTDTRHRNWTQTPYTETGHRDRTPTLDTETGHIHWTRHWTQTPDTETGHRDRTQRLHTETGHRHWTQKLDTETGHRHWTQRLDTFTVHRHRTQRLYTETGHKHWTHWTQTLDTGTRQRDMTQTLDTETGHIYCTQTPDTETVHRDRTQTLDKDWIQTLDTGTGHRDCDNNKFYIL
ncbi:hypothetical protein ScPMuIL_002005 [Solemya velum]